MNKKKIRHLTDDKLKEFVEASLLWADTGVLNNKDFITMAEELYPSYVDALRMFETQILFEAGRRFCNIVMQKKKSTLCGN